jgi:hypothetical protein
MQTRYKQIDLVILLWQKAFEYFKQRKEAGDDGGFILRSAVVVFHLARFSLVSTNRPRSQHTLAN